MSGGNSILFQNGIHLRQVFSINYGLIEYIARRNHRKNSKLLTNPIEYIYIKDQEDFQEEKELRVSLSAIGIGKMVMNDGSEMVFPNDLHFDFDFKAAKNDGTFCGILCSHDFDFNYCNSTLRENGFDIHLEQTSAK